MQYDLEYEQPANEDVFDPNQGHGSHLECIDDDIDQILQSALDLLAKSKNIRMIASPEVMAKRDGKEYDTRLILLSKNEDQEITARIILEAADNGAELVSMFPYVVNNQSIPMVLKKIDEYANGFEAVLTCEYDDIELRFFDVDYPIHKKEYVIGNTYSFALSALAYQAELVPESEMLFEIEPETVEKMCEVDPSVGERDENGNVLPMKVSMDIFAACLQNDERYPDDAEFWSPIQSKVRKATLFNYDLYRMEITIHQDESEEHIVNIPLVARASFFEDKPGKGISIRGHLWLQGRRCLSENE